MRAWYQPLVNLGLGGIMAVELLPERADGAVDPQLVLGALSNAKVHTIRFPLLVSVGAETLTTGTGALDDLRRALRRTGRHEHEVTIEIRDAACGSGLREMVEEVREGGFRTALRVTSGGTVSPTQVTDLRPDLLRLGPEMIEGLPERRDRLAIVDAMRVLAEAAGAALVVEGVRDHRTLTAVRRLGVRFVQGDLLAPISTEPPSTPHVAVPEPTPSALRGDDERPVGPLVAEFLVPAASLPQDATADDAREIFRNDKEITGIVLMDERGAPVRTLDRNRFLLAVSGPYGHALHAKKPAFRLADKPRLVTTSTTAAEALRLVASSEAERVYDDAVVVDEAGRCLGVVRASDLLRGVSEQKVQQAAALNPLTRLPGSEHIDAAIRERVDRGDEFAVGWLDIDSFKTINNHAGVAAGDELLRAIGGGLHDVALARESVEVAHIGGDDFLFVCAPEDLEVLASEVLDRPRTIGESPVDLSMATLLVERGSHAEYHEITQRLAPLKRLAGQQPGTSWVMSRPGHPDIETLRGGESVVPPGSWEEPSGTFRLLQRSSRHFNDLFAIAPVGLAVFDQSERLVSANAALCRLLARSQERLSGCGIDDFAHPQDHGGSLRSSAMPGPGDPNPGVMQRVLLRSDGKPVSCELHTALSVHEDGSQSWLVIFQDITERLRQAASLHHQATHDDLTGLPNRVAVNDLLTACLSGADRERTGVLLCDVDKFKRVNDSLGHDAGDELLIALARILRSGVPEGCTVARLAGDEFVVICPDVEAVGGIDALAARVAELLEVSVPVQRQTVRVSGSVGGAVAEHPDSTANELLRQADAAMFEAKRNGPGAVSLASHAQTGSASQLDMECRLRRALERDELELHYQPMVTMDGSIVAAEALLRWPHPEHGMLNPGVILPIAEQGGLLRTLDDWVLHTALGQAVQWPRHDGRAPSVSINLGSLVPGTADFSHTITDAVARAGIAPGRVILELVETALVDLSAEADDAMRTLAGEGIEFAVDDFGTGHSSLARLKDLPVQIIKADKRFVAGIGEDPVDFAVAHAVVDLARAMGRRCVAEGVETVTQFQVLKGLGVNAYQGWLFSHPVTHEELCGLLRDSANVLPAAG